MNNVCLMCVVRVHGNSTKHGTHLTVQGRACLLKIASHYTVVLYLFIICIPDELYPACLGLHRIGCVSFVYSPAGVQLSLRGWIWFLLDIFELAVSVATRPGDVQKYSTRTKSISRDTGYLVYVSAD